MCHEVEMVSKNLLDVAVIDYSVSPPKKNICSLDLGSIYVGSDKFCQQKLLYMDFEKSPGLNPQLFTTSQSHVRPGVVKK